MSPKRILQFCCLGLFFVSCSKNGSKSKTQLLTDVTWKFSTCYMDITRYPIKVYDISSSDNQRDFSKNRIIYRPDGAYHEIVSTGYVYDGTWSFIDDASKIKVVSTRGTFTLEVRQLDATHFTWYDASQEGGTEGTMIPD